jgi:hypothetical protein
MSKKMPYSAPHLFTTKGMFLRRLEEKRYVIHDVFGTCSLPFAAEDEAELVKKMLENFRLRLLVDVQIADELPYYKDFNWDQLEYYYVAHLDYALHRYFMSEECLPRFYDEKLALPVAYVELGHGEGSRKTLETIDKHVREAVTKGIAPFSQTTLDTWLVINQFERICGEILSLISRAIASFVDLLKAQRTCIFHGASSISQLRANEVIHQGPNSYAAATAASMSAISMCTSLDLLSKLIHYLDPLEPGTLKFKPAGGRHFSDLIKFKARRVPKEISEALMHAMHSDSDIAELIQFRHDVVHSTSVLELEKVYVGVGTFEINDAPLHYSYQGWRDCLPNGQPERYLGRDFFVENNHDIEHRIFTWLHSVISLQIDAAKRIHEFLKANTKVANA